ncbi:MAG TPA: radical SAM protein [Steroidobacteraceae bacterium]
MASHPVETYSAPLFIAWQLTNRCLAGCLACCEESGPDKAWSDELTREQALKLARQIVAAGIPYVAFGGGEPLGVSYCWEIFDLLARARISLKLETEGRDLDDVKLDRLAALAPLCIQISVDGASAITHERSRPGSNFAGVIAGIRRLTARGLATQMVFAPNRLNIHEIGAAYDLATELGCEAFVTGPLMRIGRAAANWEHLACSEREWERAVHALRLRELVTGGKTALAIYPWDILTELRKRQESPQAMLLVVPNGRVKLLNALPFSPADLRRDSLEHAWRAYLGAWRSSEVATFVAACQTNPDLLRHANEIWPVHRQSAAFAEATVPN